MNIGFMKSWACVIFLAGFFGMIQIASAEQKSFWVDAVVNTQVVSMGEQFRLVLTAGARQACVHLPGKNVVLPGCRVIDYREQDVSSRHEGFIARRGSYYLVAFTIEEVIIPSLPVLFQWPQGNTAVAQSLPLEITVRSMHPKPGLKLRKPRPPRSAGKTVSITLLGTSLATILALVIYQFRRRRARPQLQPPAHLTALHQLEALGKSRLAAEGRSKPYFQEFSRILRQYLAVRYQFPAMEWSRLAIIRELEQRKIEAKQREMINRLLREADIVKFARTRLTGPTAIAQIARAQVRAREIIERTRKREVGEGKV
ncbi:hypothetical protein KAR10_08410 [bacterium]|nr:hypothetical protein [bacterium]